MKRLENKIAIVTGGASGIGFAISKRFIEEGATVVIADMNKEIAFEKSQELGERAIPFTVNIIDARQVQDLINYTADSLGKLDILVNNAGIGAAATTPNTDEETWDRIIDVNLKGTFLCMKYAIPAFQKNNGGSIINITSIAALVGLPERAAYSAAKGGILSLTRAAAIDHVSEGIRINCIAPGTVDTPWIERITQSYDDPVTARKNMLNRQPHGRLVTPDEIAAMAAYLASEEAGSTIGAVMTVDGGMTAK
jgi:NAD(P)-dependent dehydrogenase (short-subunit alcohol dehydrogenase family)